MENEKMLELIQNLRLRVRDYKNSEDCRKGGNLSVFFVDVIEISAALAEIGVLRKRPIQDSERYWFEAAYEMNFEFAGGDYSDVLEMYQELVKYVEAGDFFAVRNT